MSEDGESCFVRVTADILEAMRNFGYEINEALLPEELQAPLVVPAGGQDIYYGNAVSDGILFIYRMFLYICKTKKFPRSNL